MNEIVEITKLRTNYKFKYNYLKKLSDFIKSLPKDHYQIKVDSIQHPDGTVHEEWYRLISEGSIGKVLSFIKDNNIKFKFTNLTTEEVEQLKSKFLERQNNLVKLLKMKAENIDVSGMDFSFMKQQPYEYQKQAVAFFQSTNGIAILGDSPGVGKTLSAISYAVKNKLKTIVVCPASLKLNWRNEIDRFTYEKSYIYKYKPKKNSNEKIYSKEESLFHIINYESLETFIKFVMSHKCTKTNCGWSEESMTKKYKECPKCHGHKTIKSRVSHLEFVKDKKNVDLNPKDYDLIICDESHYLKNPNTERTKKTKKAFKDCKHKILLTGTAIKNRPYEFFSILNFLDPNEWKNAHSFGVKYCAGSETNFGWDYSGASNLDELYERISPYFLRRLKTDVLKHLPPKTYTKIPIELTEEEYREYQKIEGKIVDELNPEDDKVTALSKVQILKQFTSKIKMNHAIDLIKNIIDGGEKIVVFTEYVSTCENIANNFIDESVIFNGKKKPEEKQKAVDSFMNDDKTKIFVGTLGSASEGITLTSASITLFVDKPWDPSTFQQATDRTHRASTTADKVQIISLVCQGTIDEDIENLLEEKSKIVSKVLDGVELSNEVNKVNLSMFKELAQILFMKKQKT